MAHLIFLEKPLRADAVPGLVEAVAEHNWVPTVSKPRRSRIGADMTPAAL